VFQFLNPIWLFAIAAVTIPVAIHLWNIRPGKVLKVGSISLMDAASRKSSRSFKLLDIPLFILRCLLLIILAVLLAIPLWHNKLTAGKTKGWVLIPKENFSASYNKFKPRIDSLTSAGYEFHYFNTGFPKSDLKKILADPKDSVFATTNQKSNYWNLTRQLDTTVLSTLPVYIFTPNQAKYFIGQKPQVALNLHWQTYIPADSTATWIAGAWMNTNNTIRVVQANSKPNGTVYTYANIQSGGDQPNSPYTVTINNGQAAVNLKTGNQQPVNVDTATLRIAVYSDNYVADANYLKAALQAVTGFTQRKTIIKEYSNSNAMPIGQDWLFWLSDKPANSKILANNHNVFIYETGKTVSSNSWLNNNGSYAVTLQQQKIGLFKLIEASAGNNANVLWRDGFDNPILSKQQTGKNNSYHFYSRFNPTWNDLVWSDEFPSWMMKLMVDDKSVIAENHDKSILSQQQLMPSNISESHVISVKTTGTANLVNYFWLILVLLFLAERWLANRTQNLVTNG